MTHLLATLATLTTLTAALAACDDDAQPAGPTPVATIEVTAPTSSLLPDATVQLTAVALDDEGRVLAGRALAWTSSAPDVAVVSPTGLVTALAPGEVLIAAAADDAIGAALIVVDEAAPVVASLEIEPAGELTLDRDATVQLMAIARDADGEIVEAAVIDWTTDDDTIASVTAAGAVTALAPGEASITATSEGHAASVRVVVADDATAVASVAFDEDGPLALAPGASSALHARAYAAGGELIEGRPVTWSTDDATVATVDAAGVATALAEGAARITATIDGHAASIELLVSPVVHVELTPGEAVLAVDEALPLTATPRDAQAQPLDRPVTWSSDRPDVASVDAAGRVTGRAVGVAAITATSAGRQATVRLSVTSAGNHLLASIDGQPLPAELYDVEVPWPGGGTVTTRVVLHDGTLNVSHAQGRYWLQLWGMSSHDGGEPGLTGFEQAGTVAWDPIAQVTRFTSDEGHTPLDSVMQPDGSLVVTLPLGEGYPTRTLRFVVE